MNMLDGCAENLFNTMDKVSESVSESDISPTAEEIYSLCACADGIVKIAKQKIEMRRMSKELDGK